MKILLTGGTGFLGPHVLDHLLASGEKDVRCLVRAGSSRARIDEVLKKRNATVEVVAGSLTVEGVAAATQLMPDLIAVRTAACDAGRGGTVSIQRVRELKRALAVVTGKTG